MPKNPINLLSSLYPEGSSLQDIQSILKQATPTQLKELNIILQNYMPSWIPRPDQASLWFYLTGGGLRAVEVAHRRWGKDDVALHFTCQAAHERVGNYWHMLPKYDQARKVLWEAINPWTGKRRIDEVFPLEIRAKTKEQEMLIEFKCGSIWQLIGSDNYNTVVGAPPIGIVFSEWAIANPLAWAYLSPILEENGGWALFIYTPRGTNHGKTIFDHAQVAPGWFGQIITADQTPVFTQKQLATIRADLNAIYGTDTGEALYQQEYQCSWQGAILGAYYAKQIFAAREQGRITDVPYQPGHEVHTFWDLGVDDSMAIWFVQTAGQTFRFIDYYENSGYGLEHYARILKEKSYVYGNHFMPHDADIREQTSPGEIALSRKEVAENLGIKPIIVVPRAQNIDMIIQVHIPAVRNLLAISWFDKTKCAVGLSALEGYATEYDEEKKKLGNRPAHSWHSHGADSMRTGAVGFVEPVKKKKNWRGEDRGSWISH